MSHVNEAESNALNCQTKVNDLSYQINELERNLTIKTWNIDRKLHLNQIHYGLVLSNYLNYAPPKKEA